MSATSSKESALVVKCCLLCALFRKCRGARTVGPCASPELHSFTRLVVDTVFARVHHANMDSSTQSALQGCVTSLRSSMQLLESSINILDSGVNDYPRLGKVLQTTRVCRTSGPSRYMREADGKASTLSLSLNVISRPRKPRSCPRSSPR